MGICCTGSLKDSSPHLCLNLCVFTGEKSQDAGIQRTRFEVCNVQFDLVWDCCCCSFIIWSFHFRSLHAVFFFRANRSQFCICCNFEFPITKHKLTLWYSATKSLHCIIKHPVFHRIWWDCQVPHITCIDSGENQDILILSVLWFSAELCGLLIWEVKPSQNDSLFYLKPFSGTIFGLSRCFLMYIIFRNLSLFLHILRIAVFGFIHFLWVVTNTVENNFFLDKGL